MAAMRKQQQYVVAAVMVALVVLAGGARAQCQASQLMACASAILTGAKPSPACCGNLRAQQGCFCQYAKDPQYSHYITSPHARETVQACGLAVPHC